MARAAANISAAVLFVEPVVALVFNAIDFGRFNVGRFILDVEVVVGAVVVDVASLFVTFASVLTTFFGLLSVKSIIALLFLL